MEVCCHSIILQKQNGRNDGLTTCSWGWIDVYWVVVVMRCYHFICHQNIFDPFLHIFRSGSLRKILSIFTKVPLDPCFDHLCGIVFDICCLRQQSTTHERFFTMLVDTPPPWCIDTANLSLQHWKTFRTLSLASVWENATTTTFRAHHVHPRKLTCWMIFLCKEGWFFRFHDHPFIFRKVPHFQSSKSTHLVSLQTLQSETVTLQVHRSPWHRNGILSTTKLSGFSSPI